MRIIPFITSVCFLLTANVLYAQTIQSYEIEDGGSGPYKAIVVADESLPAFTVYRPVNMNAAVEAQGKLPVILYANGACANSTVQMRFLLNDVASYGYIAVGIGPFDHEDPNANWTNVLMRSYPEDKDNVVLSNGTRISKPTPEQTAAAQEEQRRRFSNQNNTGTQASFRTYPKQLLEALDWLTDQNADPEGEYFHMIDIEHVVVMGQSCGGAQALSVAHDPRVSTVIALNSGFGAMSMQGGSAKSLASLHTPVLYLIGGPTDIAYENAAGDFEAINHVPVVMINTRDGHNGTYYEKNGGPYAIVVRKWLDWQLKGKIGQSALFLDDEYFSLLHSDWTIARKNYQY